MKLQIDLSGIGGLAPKSSGDICLGATAKPALRYIGKSNQVAGGLYNPFKRYGYLSAGNDTYTLVTADGGAPNTIIGSTIYDIVNDDTYFGEVGQELYKGDGLNDTTLSAVVDYGASTDIHDLEIYQINDVKKLFTVYKDASDYVQIGISDLPYDTSDDDLTWLSITATNPLLDQGLTNQAFMRVADNGFAYLFMDNQIHKIDGTSGGGANGTISANVITFPAHFQITDAVDYGGNLYIALRQDKANQFGQVINVKSQVSSCGIYIWDRLSSVVKMRDYIPLSGVKEIRKVFVSPQGNLRLFTTNSSRVTEIRGFTGSIFKVIKTIGYTAAPMYHDSVSVHSLLTTWYAHDGNIYSYGQITEGDKEALYNIGRPSAINAAGAILVGGDLYTDEGFYITSILTAGTTPRIYKWSMFGDGTPHKGDVYSLVKYLPQMSTVNYIDIYCRPAGSGSGTIATIKPYFNQSASAWASKTISLDDASRGYKRIEINKPYVNSIQLEIEFATNVNLSGDTDFAPSFAVIDFSPTKTKG